MLCKKKGFAFIHPSSCTATLIAQYIYTVFIIDLFSDSWDCIVTCYFIDTAHNVIAYIENISKILKPGGYWINLGKLKAAGYEALHVFCKALTLI